MRIGQEVPSDRKTNNEFGNKWYWHFLLLTPTNWLRFCCYLSNNLLFLSRIIVPFPILRVIQRRNDELQQQLCLTLIAFIFLFSRSSQSSSCYQQRQQLLQWPLQRHMECAQLFQNHRISNLIQKSYRK